MVTRGPAKHLIASVGLVGDVLVLSGACAQQLLRP